jgi:hypothetical protein
MITLICVAWADPDRSPEAVGGQLAALGQDADLADSLHIERDS